MKIFSIENKKLILHTVKKKIIKMADNKHKSHEEENNIEKLNDHLTRTGTRIAENKKVVMTVAGAVIAVGLLVAAYFYFFHNPSVDKAFNAYGNVEISNQQGNDTTAAEGYKKVADQYSGTDAGNLAALEAAEHFYEIGKYQEALNYLDKFSTSEEVLKANVSILRGDCYVNLKKYDQAIKEFETAAAEGAGNTEIAPRAMLKQATVYDAQKKYDKAIQLYEQIVKEYPQFSVNNVAMNAFIERDKARLGK